MAVAVVKDGEIVYKQVFGYANASLHEEVKLNTVFELGTINETFTGLTVRQLEQLGKLHLKDNVSQYLSWFKMNYQGQEMPITLEQLLYQKAVFLVTLS